MHAYVHIDIGHMDFFNLAYKDVTTNSMGFSVTAFFKAGKFGHHIIQLSVIFEFMMVQSCSVRP